MGQRKLFQNLRSRVARPAAVFAALLTLLYMCSLAKADSLPAPTYSTTGAGTVSLSPDASVFADAVIGPGQSGGGTASLTYDFEVDGPANTDAIVDITGETLVAFDGAEPGTYFNVAAGIALGGGGVMSAFCGSNYDLADCVLGVNKSVMEGVADNTLYTLRLSAEVSAENYYVDATTTVAALVDPMISFDPSFNSTGFTVELSPGVGNEFIPRTLTPEPPTFFLTGALLLLGAAALWFSRDRCTQPNGMGAK
jgi:hypothetical protein